MDGREDSMDVLEGWGVARGWEDVIAQQVKHSLRPV